MHCALHWGESPKSSSPQPANESLQLQTVGSRGCSMAHMQRYLLWRSRVWSSVSASQWNAQWGVQCGRSIALCNPQNKWNIEFSAGEGGHWIRH